jgi:hypothetical protein
MAATVGDVVVDADSELPPRRRLRQFVEHRLDHAGAEFLARQAVAAADDFRHGARAVRRRLRQRRDHILVQRLAVGARFLAAVEHGDRLHVAGKRASSAVG